MIRRDMGGGWELVRQPDHAQLAAVLADRIGDRPRGPEDAFRLAVVHHDDGWNGRDGAVTAGPDGGPETFLDVDLGEHLMLSDLSVRSAAERHPYAGAIVARHVAWLHGGRPVDDPALADRRDALVAAWRSTAVAQAAAVGVDEAALDHDQRLCGLVDFLSLWLCGWRDDDVVDVERPGGEAAELVRDGDVVRGPRTLLATEGRVTVPVTRVAAAAPFAVVDTYERSFELVVAG